VDYILACSDRATHPIDVQYVASCVGNLMCMWHKLAEVSYGDCFWYWTEYAMMTIIRNKHSLNNLSFNSFTEFLLHHVQDFQD